MMDWHVTNCQRFKIEWLFWRRIQICRNYRTTQYILGEIPFIVPTNFETVPSDLVAFPEAMLWPSVPQPLWTSFLSYGEHGEIKKIREEANIQGNGKMTKPGYTEEPSLKVSFSRHVTCVRMNSNIQIGKYVVMYYFLYGIGWHSNLDSFLQEKETLRRVIL